MFELSEFELYELILKSIPLTIIGLIGFLFFTFVLRGKMKWKRRYLEIFSSREDLVSQIFFLLSLSFFMITLFAFNRMFGDPLSSRAILFITSLVGLILAYYFKLILLFPFSLLGLYSWWGLQAIKWIEEAQMERIEITFSSFFSGLAFIALLYYLIGRAHEVNIKFRRVSLIYSMLGLFFIVGIIYVFSTDSGIKMLELMTGGVSFFGSLEITLSLFLLFLSLLGLLFYCFLKKLIFKLEALAVGFLIGLFTLFLFLPPQEVFLREKVYYFRYSMPQLSSLGIFWAIFFNVLIFLLMLGIIFLGYRRKEDWLINLGSFFLFLLILSKYFDWFYGFLSKSIFFIGAGILLLFLGWLMEKGRRRMIFKIREIKEK